MEKKQTALDWFIENFERYIHWTDKAIEIFEEAKQMEKEQIINAYEDGHLMGLHNLENTGKQHYNETYQTK